LIEIYSGPVFRFLRKRGLERDEAEEVTQGFFAAVLEQGGLPGADPTKGSFRNFLRTAVKRYRRGEWRRAQAKRRGGGLEHVRFSHDDSEVRHLAEDAQLASPELALQREWMSIFVARVDETVRAKYEAEDKRDVFEAFRPFVFDDPEYGEYGTVAERLGITRNYAGVLANRIRRHWREAALAEARRTCGSVEEAKGEVEEMMVLARG
jgi:RNA polymerase sigma-70 factor (ECF subfamily)